MLVNLNYRNGVHINFAQSRIPALACSPQSEYGCRQARSQGDNGGNASLIPKFQVNKIFEVHKPKKYFSANQRNCLKEPILLQLLVEHKLVSALL